MTLFSTSNVDPAGGLLVPVQTVPPTQSVQGCNVIIEFAVAVQPFVVPVTEYRVVEFGATEIDGVVCPPGDHE